MTNAQRIAALRQALAAKYGARKYKITGHAFVNEQIHAYGNMPNSTEIGWFLIGDIIAAECWMGL